VKLRTLDRVRIPLARDQFGDVVDQLEANGIGG
jgi:hypothetical protein